MKRLGEKYPVIWNKSVEENAEEFGLDFLGEYKSREDALYFISKENLKEKKLACYGKLLSKDLDTDSRVLISNMSCEYGPVAFCYIPALMANKIDIFNNKAFVYTKTTEQKFEILSLLGHEKDINRTFENLEETMVDCKRQPIDVYNYKLLKTKGSPVANILYADTIEIFLDIRSGIPDRAEDTCIVYDKDSMQNIFKKLPPCILKDWARKYKEKWFVLDKKDKEMLMLAPLEK